MWKNDLDDGEDVRLNVQHVEATAERAYNFIEAQQDHIHITSLAESREATKVKKEIEEAHNVEQKRRQTTKNEYDEVKARTQKAKDFDCRHKKRGKSKDAIERRLAQIFGEGSHQEIEERNTKDKTLESRKFPSQRLS